MKNTLSLYQISTDFQELLELQEQAQESNDTEQLQALESAFDITVDNFKDKADNYSRFILSEEASLEGINSEIKRLQALKKSKENKIEFLKVRLLSAIQLFNFSKFDLGIFKLSLRSSKAVEVAEGAVIPSDYQRITVTPDKTGLKKAIEGGATFEGVEIVERQSLQIK